MGKSAFPQGRAAMQADTLAGDEAVASCRWGYQCSVCLLAGDLLCCEHPDCCSVSVHPECTGQAFPAGPWVCTNHDDRQLKTRTRRRGSRHGDDFGEGSGRRGGGGGGDSEATVSEETQSAATADSEATQDEDAQGPRKRRR